MCEVQIHGEVISFYLRHTCAHTHIHMCIRMHICILLFSSRWGWAKGTNPLSNSNSSRRRFPSSHRRWRWTGLRWRARNVVIAEVMIVPTVRRGEQNGGDYVTLKFNSAIVSRASGTESEGTLILFRKTTRLPRQTLAARSRPETVVQIPGA